jgi:hypothetical protein
MQDLIFFIGIIYIFDYLLTSNHFEPNVEILYLFFTIDTINIL